MQHDEIHSMVGTQTIFATLVFTHSVIIGRSTGSWDDFFDSWHVILVMSFIIIGIESSRLHLSYCLKRGPRDDHEPPGPERANENDAWKFKHLPDHEEPLKIGLHAILAAGSISLSVTIGRSIGTWDNIFDSWPVLLFTICMIIAIESYRIRLLCKCRGRLPGDVDSRKTELEMEKGRESD